jgi:hypothetical protein
MMFGAAGNPDHDASIEIIDVAALLALLVVARAHLWLIRRS